ncbi:MAG: cytochrome c [Candidatus Rokubacteria bacterium]|nr:cytochrome c [Candidatus Rokubacteria bacterium]
MLLVGALALGAACAAAQERSALIARGQQLFVEQGCHGCHTAGRLGTPLATDLSRIGGKYSESYLTQWLRDPAVQKPTAHMPRINLSDSEVRALAAYLASLR